MITPKETMTQVPVTSATMAGSTAEAAAAVADELSARGLSVDVQPMTEVSRLGLWLFPLD